MPIMKSWMMTKKRNKPVKFNRAWKAGRKAKPLKIEAALAMALITGKYFRFCLGTEEFMSSKRDYYEVLGLDREPPRKK